MAIEGEGQGTAAREPGASDRFRPDPALAAPPPPALCPDESAEAQPAARTGPRPPRKVGPVPRLLVFLFVITLSLALALYGRRFSGLGAYGYPGLFLVNMLASATLILPIPGMALAFGAGPSLHPILVGLAAGSGATIGELTGYLAGVSGRGVVEDRALYDRLRAWMERYGLWVLFVLGTIPNPLFDIAGVIAGAMKIPVWKFLVATGAGKVLKATLIAYAGIGTMNRLVPFILKWLAR